MDDVLSYAIRLVEDNVRHTEDSIREMLWAEFPDEPDEVIDAAARDCFLMAFGG